MSGAAAYLTLCRCLIKKILTSLQSCSQSVAAQLRSWASMKCPILHHLWPDSFCTFWFCMIVRALYQMDQYPNILICKKKYTLILGNIQYPVFRGAGPYCFTIGFASILCFLNLYIVYQARFCGILVFWNLYISISDPLLQGPINLTVID